MKREIKFRAWDKYLKVMITPFIDFIHFEESERCNEMQVIETHYEADDDFAPTYIMQFTGLHYSNGEEVYEGDIIHYQEFYEGDYREREGNGYVEWDEEGHSICYCKCDEVAYVCSTWDAVKNYGAVKIGTIYENPELL